MKTYAIYLKSGHVVQVKSKSTLDELMLNIWEAPDERQLLIEFAHSNVVIVKSHISAIKDVTEKQPKEPLAEYVGVIKPSWLVNSVPAQFKPWDEQK